VGGRAIPAQRVGNDITGLYSSRGGCATLPVPIPDQVAWASAGMHGLRRLVPIGFHAGPDAALVGWSLLRLDEGNGMTEALLLDLFAPATRSDLCGWMVAETVAMATAAGSSRIRARTSCPSLQASLRSNRFMERGAQPIHVWTAGQPAPPGPYHLGMNVGDAVLLPYPSRWPPRGAKEIRA
jgi:hypothetical protein